MDLTGIEAPQLLALCVLQEAANQPDDGQAAVAKVVLNRTRMKYASDGSIEGTILHPNAFSWTEWEMVNRAYTKVAMNQAEQVKRVRQLHDVAQRSIAWAHCQNIADEVMSGAYSGPAFKAITDAAVLYYNPVATRGIPAWAKPESFVCQIGAHWFYRDPPVLARAA